jgi:hypothetical protein
MYKKEARPLHGAENHDPAAQDSEADDDVGGTMKLSRGDNLIRIKLME